MRESKANYHGKTEYATVMRHKQVDMRLSPVLGILFFARYAFSIQHRPERLPGCVAPGLPNILRRKS
ncbi:hypothetical protein I352_02057 [Cryptococcus deuterogattii MMRL2647]|nr:hypothetical protein I352_02057 [Cryptococcus deuterogattii MMRL2647]